MTRVFLTGATGFIGGRLADHLAKNGASITALVRPTSRTERLKALGAELVVGDVREPEAYRAALKRSDRAYHAAALVDVVKPSRDEILSINIEGTERLLGACRAAGVPRVVHFSSIAALGNLAVGLADETTELVPPYASHYEETKHRSDAIAVRYARDGLDLVRVMPSVVLGHGDPKTGLLLRRFLRRKIFALPRTKGAASYVDVDDLVEGVELAATRGRAGEAYVFTQVNWTHEELFQHLEEVSGVPAPRRRISLRTARWAALAEEIAAAISGRRARISRKAIQSLDRRHCYSSAKARRELGWEPQEFLVRLKTTMEAYMADLEGRRGR